MMLIRRDLLRAVEAEIAVEFSDVFATDSPGW